MEKETRNAIQSATQKARRVLENDFQEQLEGVYDIHVNGSIAPAAGPHLSAKDQRQRDRIVAAIEHKRAFGMKANEAVLDYLRGAAFTTLNRFVALKMLEARDIVQECISKGDASSGFAEFSGLAPGIKFPDGSGYRLYLECIFDELSTEVKVLFDRRDLSAVLWPKRGTFEQLLEILNAPELAGVWSEDETIGWVYQFFNGQDERRKMREESQAPRNSRELAVRNQFFTPRYVVQFLSDNTLGRIWYEMRRGKTRLAETCEYMVRRPNEVFLGDPRQAYEQIFGTREDGDYSAPAPVAAAYRGDLKEITDDDGLESRWISLALPPDEIAKISGEPYSPFEEDRVGRLISDLIEDHPNPDTQNFPLVWAAISRFTLNDGGGAYSLKPWKQLWSKFVTLSRGEQVSMPEFVPYRAPKDPRDMRVLDPACGSGHFLLYCFDLLLVMYEEAWADETSPASEVTGKTLREDYPDIADLRAALPGLILRHNLHGVDIDPRCAQIGQLALWMRAQRAFKDFGIGRAERPIIRRANIVIAEPMPGEKDLLKEFLAELNEDKLAGLIRRALDVPADKRVRATKAMADSLAELVETVWDGMKLAGEMGTLLKIERDLARAIDKGRAEWEDTLPLFRVADYGLGGITNEQLVRVVPGAQEDFWTKAEKLVFQALADYAAAASGTGNARRRLFAEDAAQGFALADLVAKKFDVVLMNPPFGEATLGAQDVMDSAYPAACRNVYCAFAERARGLLEDHGRCGAITDRSFATKQGYETFRRSLIASQPNICLFADMGWGVLDANVETCAWILSSGHNETRFIKACDGDDSVAAELRSRWHDEQLCAAESLNSFGRMPFATFAYGMPASLRAAFRDERNKITEHLMCATRGMVGANADHLYRVLWEIPESSIGSSKTWGFLQKGSPYSPHYYPVEQLLRHDGGTFRSVMAYDAGRLTGREDYGRPGLSYGKRTDYVYAFPMPAGCIFSVEGQAIFAACANNEWQALAIANSSAFQELLNHISGQHKYHV